MKRHFEYFALTYMKLVGWVAVAAIIGMLGFLSSASAFDDRGPTAFGWTPQVGDIYDVYVTCPGREPIDKANMFYGQSTQTALDNLPRLRREGNCVNLYPKWQTVEILEILATYKHADGDTGYTLRVRTLATDVEVFTMGWIWPENANTLPPGQQDT